MEQLALCEEFFVVKSGGDVVVCSGGHWLICVTLPRWGEFGGMSNFRHFLWGSAGKLKFVTPPGQTPPNEKHLRDTVSSLPTICHGGR
jgi:hypothetical protein